MKNSQFSGLAALALILLAVGSAAASDSQWRAIDNHHGASTYLPRSAETSAAIAFGGHAKGAGSTTTRVTRTNSSVKEPKSGFREVTTPHGTVNYFEPAE
jgi:hypothetical protein